MICLSCYATEGKQKRGTKVEMWRSSADMLVSLLEQATTDTPLDSPDASVTRLDRNSLRPLAGC
ncbi:unnamed protein product [Amoebophrya sp. A120]|nr:unnamed protein product [Amoebophrya sp. A120]|eukprot:GSA120T00008431001.1